MRKNKILEKLLAIILIFTLTSANFAFVTKSFATSFAETLFGDKSDTGHKNVGFEAYFGTEDEKETSVVSDVNNEELSISMKVDVQKAGYLKDAKIEIAEAEEGKGLNFELKEMEELPEYVQGFEDNVLYLQQINCSSEANLEIPLVYKNEKYVNENKFTNNALVKFSGIYVDDDGEENEVSRDIELTVSWKDKRDVKVETEVTKYIDFGRGIILQTLVKVDTQTEKNTLPIKDSTVTIEVPKLNDVAPSNITVAANSTMGTNGKIADEINFNEYNWNYNEDENKLSINVSNQKELVRVDEFEDEYLKDADKEVVEEERYYNQSGTDEYLVTYTYEDASISEESVTLNSNIEAKVVTFSGVEQDEFINIITNTNNYDYLLEGKTGDIVSLNIENETEEVSKAYTYANYNNSNYESEFLSKTMINVSYKEIVKSLNVEDVENTYLDKDGNKIENNDLYYKQISILKENFLNMLGEEGTIKVSDQNGNEIVTINNETPVNDDEVIVIYFNEKVTKLNYEISSPVGEGNLVISNVKAMKDSEYAKSTFANLSSIVTNTIVRADYDFVETRVDVQNKETKIDLAETVTKATLKMDRDSLSTLAVNNDVELRVELNNAVDVSDIYGHSVYEIELPEYVEYLEVTNASLLYAEGLDITSVDVDGKIIRITVDGKQDGINSGVLTNGTNIIINANIKVNLYTPAKEEVIKLRYVNDEATNYVDDGYTELPITYSAPTGLVAVNSTLNYNNLGTVTTSVRQGLQKDLIDIYSDAKVATMEVIVMNNNANTVSNVSILGRIPFKGVKDIATGEDLGTTLDTRMVSRVLSDDRNNANFNVYYSENGDATNDLNKSENGWTMDPENLDNVKSYLIVPVEENYEMEKAEILRFTYEYEIPANLSHNQEIYGTFQAYYTNNSDVATTDETSNPDIIGLTTGEGPELSIEVAPDKDTVKASEELNINVKVENIGKNRAENIVTTIPVPRFTTYKNVSFDQDGLTVENVDGNVITTLASLEENETLEFTVTVVANKIPTIAEYYKNTEGFMKREDGVYVIRKYSKSLEELEEIEGSGEEVTYEDTEITSLPDVKIDLNGKVSAKELSVELNAETKQVNLKEASFKVTEYAIDDALITDTQPLGTEYRLGVTVMNCSSKEQINIVATKALPSELEFVSASVENDAGTAEFDQNTNTIVWKISNLDTNKYVNLNYNVKSVSLPEGVLEADVDNYTQVKSDESETYTSNNLQLKVGKPVLVVSQTTSTTDTYIKEGDVVEYIFSVKNEGSVKAKQVSFVDEVPEGLNVRTISYITDGNVIRRNISSNSEAIINLSLSPNSETTVNVQAIAGTLNGAQEKTVTNVAEVSAPNIEKQTTNSITHIVESSGKDIVSSELTTSSSNTTSNSSSNLTKTYKISGTAWEDADKDGMRAPGEKLLSGITTRLVNSETGVIQKSTTTDANGLYTFAGVENGNYLVIFEFDTVKYTATAYRKDGVESNVNSDALMTKLEQDGKTRNGAVSDVITVSDGSISGIDIGLSLADAFDLKLDKTISKVTVQTVKDTHTDEYENTNFAKTEIASKYVSGATVYVEYAITVTNVGDVAGFAKKIIDYLPEGMTFNSSLEANADWYTGTDGNLYSTALSEKELLSGQSQTLKLVLTKQLTEENTGLINNLAEICEDYNIYGISDKNSTPGNKAQGENDLGSADMIIAIKTGEVFIHISVIITSMLLGSIVIFIAYNRIVVAKRKGGV